jgi:hypothetical protein
MESLQRVKLDGYQVVISEFETVGGRDVIGPAAIGDEWDVR